ncbi:MAG: hypothetical protein KUG69_07685 [Marinosulfonomonas sp.]|nr:hypothetical protein [Marinosulfonomonas sp.]
METRSGKMPPKKTPDDRKDRLKTALKANLKRRKAQARVRNSPDIEKD